MIGPFGGRENVGGGGNGGDVAPHAWRNPRRPHEIEIGLGLENVARQRQEHRPARRRERGLGRAMDEARQVGDAMDLRGPFDEGPRQTHEVGRQHGLGDEIVEVLLAGGDEHRRRRLLGVVEHAHGIAEAGRDVKVQHREFAGGLRVAVGHGHQRRFLEPEDVADVVLDRERIHQRQFGGAGIAEHHLDAFLFQEIEEGALSGHHGQDWSPPQEASGECE